MRDPVRPEELRAMRALTGIEERIAVLGAEGRTNAEIADEVGLSRSAVAWHLWRIYRKLGVDTRSQLPKRLPAAPGGDGAADVGLNDERRGR